MATHYGNIKATFYRDFISQQILNPSSGGIGGPITHSRNNAATYIGSDGYLKTAAANEPRFTYEYDSSGILRYRGLLIEDTSGNNQFLHSEDFSQSVWTKTNSSIASSAVLSPDGISYAQELSLSSSGGKISQSLTISTTGSNKRDFYCSIMVKADECSFLNINVDDGTGNSIHCYYNLTLGTLLTNTTGTSGAFEFTYRHIVNMGNGWFRCILAVKDNRTVAKTYTVSFIPTTSSNSLTINSSGNGLYIWGAMLEHYSNIVNNYHYAPHSYFKTTTSIFTGVTESCYVASSINEYNRLSNGYPAIDWSIYVEFTYPTFFRNTISGNILYMSNTTGGQTSLRVLNSSANTLYRYPGFSYDYGSYTIQENNNKFIMCNRTTGPIYSCFNGVIHQSSVNITPQTFTTLYLYGQACYKKIFYIPTFLNMSQIQRLTAL
jgi:hypothetical protein